MLVDRRSMCGRVVFSPIGEGNYIIYFFAKRRKRVKHYFRFHVDL